MDMSDPLIEFYGDLGCNNCLPMKQSIGKTWFMDDSGLHLLEKLIAEIKSEGVGKKYDSIIGLSGGIDSTYLALKCFDWGLRPLIVHVDAGWNSEIAVSNIQALLDFTGWELQTWVVNWEEMQDLQRSFLKSGVANLDVPQDHVYFSSLYKFATDSRIKFILNGGNIASEGILPSSWLGSAMDSINLLDIHKKYGTLRLLQYPRTSFFNYYFNFPILKGMRPVRPLNLLPYSKDAAAIELRDRVGFRTYPRKHGESFFTRIFQDYILIERYNIDKRLAHYSSLIVSGQMTRSDALVLLTESLYTNSDLEKDIDFLCKKLEITREEFQMCLELPRVKSSMYKNWIKKHRRLKNLQHLIEKITKRNLRFFS
jgi:N-acetyl sugar amidotransferase